MTNKAFILAIAAGLSFAVSANYSAFASGGYPVDSFDSLAVNAVSKDPAIASAAIARLREQGQAGLDALLTANAAFIQQHNGINAAPLPPEQQAAWERLQNALDGVSAQRDCSASRLYWYTDFEQAKAAAKTSGKPILSLRLLGKLNEEYSCANSRFFRTTLYANAEVSHYLRDHFILHWKSVRPVPRITVDFGDGRKIERTITGNSIHYVLDADGRVVDALPGLYGPKAFLKGLNDAEVAAQKSGQLAGDELTQFLRHYHTERLNAIQQAWRNDMLALNDKARASDADRLTLTLAAKSAPTALSAGDRAVSKGFVEMPMLKSFQTADDATWTRVAGLHAQDAALDGSSISLISSKHPTALEAGRVAMTKAAVENPLAATLRNLQRSIAEDTVRNEYRLHSKIHEWLILGTASDNVDQLNGLVYAQLFLTPDSDPWLGLVPANTFTGLDNNGLVQSSPMR
jgi:hypothetical protein